MNEHHITMLLEERLQWVVACDRRRFGFPDLKGKPPALFVINQGKCDPMLSQDDGETEPSTFHWTITNFCVPYWLLAGGLCLSEARFKIQGMFGM